MGEAVSFSTCSRGSVSVGRGQDVGPGRVEGPVRAAETWRAGGLRATPPAPEEGGAGSIVGTGDARCVRYKVDGGRFECNPIPTLERYFLRNHGWS